MGTNRVTNGLSGLLTYLLSRLDPPSRASSGRVVALGFQNPGFGGLGSRFRVSRVACSKRRKLGSDTASDCLQWQCEHYNRHECFALMMMFMMKVMTMIQEQHSQRHVPSQHANHQSFYVVHLMYFKAIR